MTVGRSPRDDRKPGSSTAYRKDASRNASPSPSTSPSSCATGNDPSNGSRRPESRHSHASSDASDNNNNTRPAALARGSTAAYAAFAASAGATGGAASVAAAASSAATNYWKDDLSNLLTPQTVVEQAQVQRRKRNREAARRSRQKQKEREAELVERQAQLSERLKFLEQELVEWRMMNANASNSASNAAASADGQSASTLPSQSLSTSHPSLRLIDPSLVSGREDGELAENINNVYSLTMDTLRIIGELQLQLDDITRELNEMVGSSPER
ncbi:hypothetical protein GGF42_002093 [Coemansia sp. RSA 2424]|nr:hypothetical protein GGF42_002093 [Coemansia sp. RSA 2424]